MSAQIKHPVVTSPELQGRLAALIVTGPARGATVSEDWLPAGLLDELDVIRDQHLRVLAAVRDAEGEAADLRRRFRREDEAFDAEARAAVRDGRPVDDSRTQEGARLQAIREADEKTIAALEVLGEIAQDALSVVRAHEPELLGQQSEKLAQAREQRAKAETLLSDAKALEWAAVQTAQWIQHQSDDDGGIFSRQPFPVPSDAPPTFTAPDSLARPWWRERQTDAATPPEPTDPLGADLPRDPGDEGTDLIEPLDEPLTGRSR